MRPETYGNSRSSTFVIIRFCLRMIILIAFAAFAGIDFRNSVTALLWLSTILSAAFAIARRELPVDSALNYWDEAVAYIALCCMLSINQTGTI